MSSTSAKMAHVPLSQYTINELRVSASKLREMAATARTFADIQALEALGRRFDALAERREIEDYEARRAAEALALRLTEEVRLGAKHYVPPAWPDTLMGLPSPEAMQMATDALCRRYISPETRRDPQVQSACINLAYDLMAYGLVATKAGHKARQPDATEILRGAETCDGSQPTDHRILVVDDVADVLVAVGAFLANAGFTVQKAANGDDALHLIASDPDIDVLVTDFAMPGVSGVDLVTQAVQLRPNLKALVITGYPNADGLAELPPHTAILTKPFRRDALIAGVQSLLSETRLVPRELMEAFEQKGIGRAPD